MKFDPLAVGEEAEEENAKIDADPGRYLAIPKTRSGRAFAIMEAFVDDKAPDFAKDLSVRRCSAESHFVSSKTHFASGRTCAKSGFNLKESATEKSRRSGSPTKGWKLSSWIAFGKM